MRVACGSEDVIHNKPIQTISHLWFVAKLSSYFVIKKFAILACDNLCAIKNAYPKLFLGEKVLLVLKLI